MDYLVKINRKKRYVRITIPHEIAEALELTKFPFVKIRLNKNKIIEVEGVEIKGKKKR